MISLILAAQLFTDQCTTFYHVRVRYLDSTSPFGQLAVIKNEQGDLGLRTTRAEAEAERDDILAHGWVKPYVAPDNSEDASEHRVAPGSFLSVSVRRVCCRVPPIPNGWCIYPDGP